MKKNLFLLTFIFWGMSVLAQDKCMPVKTDVNEGRYEIIQSSIARNQTFKLDKKLGKVYMLVISSNNDLMWERMKIIGTISENTDSPINYQIYMGGTAVSDCFLINIHTGKTWQLVIDKDSEELIWSPMKMTN